MNKPLHLITCKSCGWQPDENVKTTDEIRSHKHEDGSPTWIGLMAYCPRDLLPLRVRRIEKTRMGRTRTTYDCPCKRSYQAVN